MFKGEPIAIWTMFGAFLSFLALQIYGILFGFSIIGGSAFFPTHYLLAFFGWIGLLILGAELQFFRAILAIRKYEPEWLRRIFLLSVFLFVLCLSLVGINSQFALLALILFFAILVIHSYWMGYHARSKLFKFPLQFFLAGNVFLWIGYLLYFLYFNDIDTYFIEARMEITHVLAIGWISLVLQGATIRILPMFLNRAIDRDYRTQIDMHFLFALISTVAFLFGLVVDISLLTIVGGLFWVINWIIVFYAMVKSIKTTNRKKPIEHKITGMFFGWGFIWLVFGAILGFILIDPNIRTAFGISASPYNFRDFHIHGSFLLGLTFIMIGALHRISAFQVYTILFSGKRDTLSLSEILHERYMVFVLFILAIGALVAANGFLTAEFQIIAVGGTVFFLGTFGFAILYFWILMLYVKNKDNAIPFYAKTGEI